MFRPKTAIIRFAEIVEKLLHIFDENNVYVHYGFNIIGVKIVDKI
jgi:hypothetical protein